MQEGKTVIMCEWLVPEYTCTKILFCSVSINTILLIGTLQPYKARMQTFKKEGMKILGIWQSRVLKS